MAMIDLNPAAREVARLLDGVDEERMGDPTPCPDYSVGVLLDHIMGLSSAFIGAARKTTESAGPPARPTAENLDPEWRALLPRRLDELAGAWRDPGAWEGMTEAGGVRLPAGVMGVVALDELVLHGWDLARATGQPFACDAASTAAVLEFTTESAKPEQAAMRDGVFGPVVAVPLDAPALDRALGLSGRDPAWTPEGR